MANRQLWPDDVQPVEALDFVRVDGAYTKVLLVRMIIVYVMLMGFVAGVALAARSNVWILSGAEGVVAAAFAANMALVRRIYRVRGYALRDRDISYRRGLLFPSVTTIPFNKIQQVSVRMNPVSRLFGLYYLDVVNGSQVAMNEISIPGLRHEDAERIKHLLINNAGCDND